jgi:probable HAF family extracellular repeat protein
MRSIRSALYVLLVCVASRGALSQSATGASAGQPPKQPTLLQVTAGADLVTITPPGGRFTRLARINSSGDVIGNYGYGREQHGFLIRQGQLLVIDHPEGVGQTRLQDLDDRGFILGDFSTGEGANFKVKYFVRRPDGQFTLLEIPKPPMHRQHFVAGFTNNGKVVVIEFDNLPPGSSSTQRKPQIIYVLEGGVLRDLQASESHRFGRVREEFKRLRFPGVEDAELRGINTLGDMVGSFGHYEGEHCFRLNAGGEMTELVVPGATRCIATDINQDGEVVGYFFYNTGIDTRGFRWKPGRGTPVQSLVVAKTPPPAPAPPPPKPAYVPTVFARGEVIPFEFPNATSTFLSGINAEGEIVGVAQVNGEQQGFVWSGGRFSRFNPPGATSINPQNISDTGAVYGTYVRGDSRLYFLRTSDGKITDPSSFEGYQPYDARGFSPQALTAGGVLIGQMTQNGIHRIGASGAMFSVLFDLPNSYANVNLRGGNSKKDIVGTMLGRSTGKTVGFILRGDGLLTEIAFPGATRTEVAGINDQGEITGTYDMGDYASHCFRTDASGTFSTLRLPEGGRGCSATGINNSGAIVGAYSLDKAFELHGFIWEPGGTTRSLAAMLKTSTAPCSPRTLTFTERGSRKLGFAALMGSYSSAMKSNDNDGARRHLRAAIATYPEVWIPYPLLGRLLSDAEGAPLLERGLNVARCALNESDSEFKSKLGDVAMVQAELGAAYAGLNLKNQATAALRAALEAAPSDGVVNVRACEGFASLQNVEEGTQPCELAVKAYPDLADAWNAKIALALVKTPRGANGRYLLDGNTVGAMQQVIRLEPDSESAKKYSDYLKVPGTP